jgi:glycosyltransferase involved in cell wall biosynthesis
VTTPVRANIDVIIPTFNEEVNLPHALASVKDWAHRVFVVDSESSDKTREVAAAHGATVVVRPWMGYAKQKNWALENLELTSAWVFILDADEVVLPELRDELLAVAQKPIESVAEKGFWINRYFVFMGRRIRHCGYYPSWNLRFFRRGMAKYEVREVHEHMLVDGAVGRLAGHLEHHDRRGLETYMAKHNTYSTLEARAIFEHGLAQGSGGSGGGDGDGGGAMGGKMLGNEIERRRWVKQTIIPRLPFAWLFRFVYMYVFRLGFLDGVAGFRFCLFISAYEMLIGLKLAELRMQRKA